MQRYTYKGDRLTDSTLKGATCTAVRNERGKCVRSHVNGSMLVEFENGRMATVIGRLLRKLPQNRI